MNTVDGHFQILVLFSVESYRVGNGNYHISKDIAIFRKRK